MKVQNALTRFSDRVEDYVRYRPGYPSAVLKTLEQRCGLTSTSSVADIGSGPGNFARMLLENGNEVFAVEPNREMRAAGMELLGHFARYHSLEGKAEETGLSAASVDFVVAAQAFHWFDAHKARAEFKRILRSGGWTVLIWNERLTASTPFLRDYEKLLFEYSTDYEQVRHENSYSGVREFFHGQEQLAKFDNQQLFDYDGLRGRLLSSSYAPDAAHPLRQPMLSELRRIFDLHSRDGVVSFDYTVKMYFGQLE